VARRLLYSAAEANMTKKSNKKLVLSRETVRVLGDDKLAHVAGGSVDTCLTYSCGRNLCVTASADTCKSNGCQPQ
jgi:hypothetical protein